MSDEMKNRCWEHFPHQADIGIRGLGRSMEEAFEAAAVALIAVIAEPQNIVPASKVNVYCHGPNEEMLLVDWLNALIYEMATRKMLFRRFEVRIAGQELRGMAWGEPLNPEKHTPAVEVKAATYTCLRVGRNENGVWLAQCVVDV